MTDKQRRTNQTLCMQRLRAEREGKDTSVFPPRERGPKSKAFTGGPIERLRKLYPGLTWRGEHVGHGAWVYDADNGWRAFWVACLAYDDTHEAAHESRFYIYKTATGESPEDVTHIMQVKGEPII